MGWFPAAPLDRTRFPGGRWRFCIVLVMVAGFTVQSSNGMTLSFDPPNVPEEILAGDVVYTNMTVLIDCDELLTQRAMARQPTAEIDFRVSSLGAQGGFGGSGTRLKAPIEDCLANEKVEFTHQLSIIAGKYSPPSNEASVTVAVEPALGEPSLQAANHTFGFTVGLVFEPSLLEDVYGWPQTNETESIRLYFLGNDGNTDLNFSISMVRVAGTGNCGSVSPRAGIAPVQDGSHHYISTDLLWQVNEDQPITSCQMNVDVAPVTDATRMRTLQAEPITFGETVVEAPKHDAPMPIWLAFFGLIFAGVQAKRR